MSQGTFSVPVPGSRAREVDYTAINAGTLDGTTTLQQAIIPFAGKHSLSLLWTWTSTVVATLGIEVSNNYDPKRPTLARWATVTDPAIVGYLNDGSATGGKPNGTSGVAFLQIDPLRAAAVRFTASRTSSSGTFTLDVGML